jgi:translation initiation factor 3 subunit D
MASPRSVNSWDLLLRKDGDNLYLDKRPLSRIDFVSVNENMGGQWSEPSAEPKESVNHADNLATEATAINHNFTQQLLSVPAGAERPPPHEFSAPNPFLLSLSKGSEPASVAFRYRRWRLPGGVQLVARCSLNGFVERKDGENAFVVAKALNETDSRLQQGQVDWRQKLELQTGAVLAAEMKNNQSETQKKNSSSALTQNRM